MKKVDIDNMIKKELKTVLKENIGADEILTGALILQSLWLLGGDTLKKGAKYFSTLISTGSFQELKRKIQKDRTIVPILTKLANDPDVVDYIKNKGRKGIRKFITPKLSEKELEYIHQIYGKDIEAIINSLQTENVIKEESMSRYVATMDFYVWASSDNNAKKEADEIVSLINDRYDNSSKIIKVVPQQFGQIGQDN